ncbi:MAG: hypothetical protein ACXVDA_21750 [Ktedonobacterales bacterium]
MGSKIPTDDDARGSAALMCATADGLLDGLLMSGWGGAGLIAGSVTW